MTVAWTTAIAILIVTNSGLSRSCPPNCVSDASCYLPGSNCPGRDSYIFRQCYKMSELPLDEGRGPTEFYANISWTALSRMRFYEPNVTYSVIYELDNEWGVVGDCYKMKLNVSSCVLRPMREKEVFLLIARTTACGCMCKRPLMERRRLPWCENDTDNLCIEIKDGEIHKRTEHYDVTFGDLGPVATDYYLFRARRIHGSFGREFTHIPFTRNVGGMEFDERKGEVSFGGDDKVKVTQVQNSRQKWPEILEQYNHTCDEMWCFFYRPRGLALSKMPICHIPWIQGNYSEDCPVVAGSVLSKLPIAVVTITVALLVIALVIVIRCCFSRIKYCRPKYEETEKQIPNDVKKIFDDPVEENGGFLPVKEVPDSFSIGIGKTPAPDIVAEDAKLLDCKAINDYCDKMCNDQSSGKFRELAGEDVDTKPSRLRLDSGLDEDVRDLCSDESDKVVIPTGYSMKVDRSDSGFETIGSVFSSGRSVDGDYNKHPGESTLEPYCEESSAMAKLNLPGNPMLDDIAESPEYLPKPSPALPKLRFPAESVLFVCVSRDTQESLDQDRRAFVADSGIYESKSPSCHNPRAKCVDIFPLGEQDKDILLPCKETSSQRDSASSCDTGCDTSSYDDPLDLGEKCTRLPNYIQEGGYFPKDVPGSCGGDIDHFTYAEGYMTK